MRHDEQNLGRWRGEPVIGPEGTKREDVETGLTPRTCWKGKAGPLQLSSDQA
jgi:hypothetical protein